MLICTKFKYTIDQKQCQINTCGGPLTHFPLVSFLGQLAYFPKCFFLRPPPLTCLVSEGRKLIFQNVSCWVEKKVFSDDLDKHEF